MSPLVEKKDIVGGGGEESEDQGKGGKEWSVRVKAKGWSVRVKVKEHNRSTGCVIMHTLTLVFYHRWSLLA